jgi:RNA polymerase sigma-70 factor (ECF subfamily)
MMRPAGWEAVPDEEIIRHVQRGEAQLFGVIFERHYARLERFVRGLGVPDADLEDVLGDTFARAFARVDSFRPETGARYVSYLYAIARNLVTDRRRSRGRMPETTLLEEAYQEPDPAAPQPAATALHRDDVERIRRALALLRPSDREIITLSYDRELSCREIMFVMGKPSVTSVTTHLYKAIRRLRDLVHAPPGTGDGAGEPPTPPARATHRQPL